MFHRLGNRWLKILLVIICVLGWVSSAWALTDCPADHIDEQAEVAKVIDGDTVKLRDGRMVRFIGINTPEVGYDGAPSQAYAEEARDELKRLLGASAHIGLRYGKELKDRYQRTLAHIYLADGRSVESYLLSQGLAAQVIVPPNVFQLECYRRAELEARQAGKGVWSDLYKTKSVLTLPKEAKGFQVVSGKIERIKETKQSIWLNFTRRPGEGWREGVAVRISRDDLGYFPGWQWKDLQGKQLTVRGWLYQYRKQQVIRVRHPAVMDIEP